MYYLFLDDYRQPEDVNWKKLPLVDWKVVKSYEEFTDEVLINGLPECMSLDRDLSICHYIDEETNGDESVFDARTGEDCLGWVMNYCIERNINMPETIIHTMNSSAAKRMRVALKDFRNNHPELSKNL